jgi:NAD(P)-dependent dehydrogenase (short-subunit alcohol dehydrogenase family)
MIELAGASAAVTGGANGIGLAIARGLAKAGARVAIGDIDAGAAEAAAASIGGETVGVGLDVSDEESFTRFLDAARDRHGPLDLLVNNAGVDWMGPFHEMPPELTRREVDVNLIGPMIGCRLALGRMLPGRSGHIVNVASGAGRVPLPGSASYSATKHGVVGLTESLRLEYRDSGVSFSVIQPAQVETAMMQGQARPRLLPVITPEEVADAVVKAVRRDRFEVWVPASQGVSFKLSAILPRRVREAILRLLGVGRIAGEADLKERREYHERTFGGSD